jgi:hypothetical protein
MPIIGHTSKMVFGWAVGESADTILALQAWERAKETFQWLDIPCAGMIMHHDRDSVYTGYEWTSQLLLKDGLRVSYALRGAKDNPEMESFHGRFKTEGHSLFLEAQTIGDLISEILRTLPEDHNKHSLKWYNFWGEPHCGIDTALDSGDLAGNVMSSALAQGDLSHDFLSRYQHEWRNTPIYRSMQRQDLIAMVGQVLSKGDPNMMAKIIQFFMGGKLTLLGKLQVLTYPWLGRP